MKKKSFDHTYASWRRLKKLSVFYLDINMYISSIQFPIKIRKAPVALSKSGSQIIWEEVFGQQSF